MEIKYNLDCVKLKVRVTRRAESDWESTITHGDILEINQYVEEHNLGRRVAFDMWQFNDKESLTLFMLRYG